MIEVIVCDEYPLKARNTYKHTHTVIACLDLRSQAFLKIAFISCTNETRISAVYCERTFIAHQFLAVICD